MSAAGTFTCNARKSKNTAKLSSAAFLLFLTLLTGCAALTRELKVNKLITEADFCGAADVLRQALHDSPGKQLSDYDSVKLRQNFLQKLAACGALKDRSATMDAEAKGVHDESIALFGNNRPNVVADFHHALANYYIGTTRLGLVEPILLDEYALRQQLGNQFHLARTQAQLGFYYFITRGDKRGDALLKMARTNAADSHIAELGLGDTVVDAVKKQLDFNSQTTRVAKSNNAANSSHPILHASIMLDEIESYAAMMEILLRVADIKGDESELIALNNIVETEANRLARFGWHPGGVDYQTIALSFKGLVSGFRASFYADWGNPAKAQQFLNEHNIVVADLIKKLPNLAPILNQDIVCLSGSVQLAAKQYSEAIDRLEDCIAKGKENRGKTWNQAKHTRYPSYLGLAYEGLGKLDKANAAYLHSITAFEPIRDDVPVAERALVFRHKLIREPYWGLIRVTAKQALASKTEQAFFVALEATDKLRARQLGDLVAPGRNVTWEALKRYKAQLAPDEAVLVYTLTDKHLATLAFSSDRQVIEFKAQDMRTLDENINAVATLLGDFKTGPQEWNQLNSKLMVLGSQLLGPVQSVIAGKKRLTVINDAGLTRIPFDILSVNATTYRPLLKQYTVRIAPSLKLLLLSNQRQPSSSGLYGLGDPRFSENAIAADVAGEGDVSISDSELLPEGLKGLSYTFPALPETRIEIDSIARALPKQHQEVVLGEQANATNVKKADLEGYRYLHFATHGILRDQVPGIHEPALVLAEEQDQTTFLTTTDIERLKLNADLAVLSACNTGSGDYQIGEGSLSMARAFSLAGARHLVVSLWSVESQKTVELMQLLYRKLRLGMPVAEALRSAKLKMIDDYEKAHPNATLHPSYWSAFILFGT